MLTVQERKEQLAIARLETSRASLAEFKVELYDLETDLTPIQERIETLRRKGMVFVFDKGRDYGIQETVIDDEQHMPSENSTLQERDAESRGLVFELGDNDAGRETVVDDDEYIDVGTSGVLSTALAVHDCGANSTGAAGRNRKTALGTKGRSVAAAFPVAVVKLASVCVPPSV